ncbi:MAG TPA: dihydrodipicolinate synthase family protein [Bryobacteraceae bacterium]|jgi:4-hydroxy-tetrahydrodipicolinate synthase
MEELLRFRGVIPILQTPFDESEALDRAALHREVNFVCDAGADGVAFPGFASEWWKLAEAEIDYGAEVVLRATEGRIPVILNITAQATCHAVEAARRFTAMGCQGLMCLPPFVGGTTSAETFRHIATVLDASPLPFMLQWSPSLAGSGMEWPHLAELERRFPHFKAVKVDFAPPGPTVTRLVEQFGGERFTYLIGFAGLELPDALERGAHGLMGGCGHLNYDIAVFRALEAATPDARARFSRLEPLLNFEMQTIHTSIATHKWLLERQGILASDTVRAPGSRLSLSQIHKLEQMLEHLA